MSNLSSTERFFTKVKYQSDKRQWESDKTLVTWSWNQTCRRTNDVHLHGGVSNETFLCLANKGTAWVTRVVKDCSSQEETAIWDSPHRVCAEHCRCFVFLPGPAYKSSKTADSPLPPTPPHPLRIKRQFVLSIRNRRSRSLRFVNDDRRTKRQETPLSNHVWRKSKHRTADFSQRADAVDRNHGVTRERAAV